jgi:hypothetical protein
MILFQEKLIDDIEVEYLLNLWDTNIVEDNEYHRDGKRALAMKWVDIKKHKLDISFLHHGTFHNGNFEKIRIQYYHESLGNVKEHHGHENVHNYVIFLNDDFTGGELQFENGITIKPSTGSLVYFNNNERHRVLPHIGSRYVFTALGNIEANIEYKIKQRGLI